VACEACFVEGEEAVGFVLADVAVAHAVDEESRHESRQFIGAELNVIENVLETNGTNRLKEEGGLISQDFLKI